MERLLGEGGPEFQVVASAAAFVAAVTPLGDVDGEVAGPAGGGVVQGTGSVPLVAGALGGLEAEQVQDLLHADFPAKPVEVNSGHVFSLGDVECCGGIGGAGPFRSLFLSKGNGNDPRDVCRHEAQGVTGDAASLWGCGGVGRRVPGIRAFAPVARS